MENEYLSNLEMDLLAELFNVGVGSAANSLSQLIHQEVKLSVPKVKFVGTDEMAEYIGVDEMICGVGQEMHGAFEAHSMLLFPESGSMDVVRLMLGEDFPDEMIAEMQQEAMSEIGNIVLNACIGSISNAMSTTIKVELPRFYHDKTEKLLELGSADNSESDDAVVLLIAIDLTLSQSDVTGYMAFLLGPTSLSKLQEQLRAILSGIG